MEDAGGSWKGDGRRSRPADEQLTWHHSVSTTHLHSALGHGWQADTTSDGRTSNHRSRMCEDETPVITGYRRLHSKQFEYQTRYETDWLYPSLVFATIDVLRCIVCHIPTNYNFAAILNFIDVMHSQCWFWWMMMMKTLIPWKSGRCVTWMSQSLTRWHSRTCRCHHKHLAQQQKRRQTEKYG